ncbi:MAG: hypothetical protein AAGF95_22885 [Chloroflexota bacterium]
MSQSHQTPSQPGWADYIDNTYGFRISYPPSYNVDHLPSIEDNQTFPKPLSHIAFRERQQPDYAPPLLSIHVFLNHSQQSLKDWLVAVGLFKPKSNWFITPFQTSQVVGLRITVPEFIAPGWWVYVTNTTHIFRITPLGTDAELMLHTFQFH